MKLWLYTRKPIDNVYYDPRLAYSVHLALENNEELIALNHNSGVLFAKGLENADGSINPESLKYPCAYKKGSEFKIYAVRCNDEYEEDADDGKVLEFSTRDFVHFDETGLVEMPDFYKKDLEACKKDCRNKEIKGELPEGSFFWSSVDISEDQAIYITKKLLPPVHVETEVPSEIEAKCEGCVKKIKATKVFSDGSEYESRVDWDLSTVDFKTPGTYEVKGKLFQQHYNFPVATNRADPCVGKYKGKYYFIATNDADGNHTLYIRESDTIPGLVTAEEHLLLDSSTYKGIGGLLWAPEFHEIGGRLCILHAATPEPFFEEESHVMILKEGGNPVNKEDWEAPKRVVKADGSNICEMGKEITLDMTHFVWEGSDYVIWSQRQFLPVDLGAWLYIAKLDPKEPWKLASEPVILRKPVYGWENNHTFVVEGPYALVNKGKLYVTYSAAAVDTSYVVGVLAIEPGKNLLDPSSWEVSNYPILTSRSVEGEFGTGHNAYVQDDDGLVFNTYHARPGTEAPRSSGIRQTFFDTDGQPVLDVTEDLSLDEDISEVRMKVVIK